MTFDDTPHAPDDYFVSTDQKLLDHRWLVANLLAQPWAQCWTHERMAEAIQNSLCFGVYQNVMIERGDVPKMPRMAGFARVLTDGAAYSMLVDVVIDEADRSKGLGRFLVNAIVNHPQVHSTVCNLRTMNCANFYAKAGFQPVVGAMRRIPS